MKRRHLKATGEYDYDYVNDIAFFKIKDREYKKSIDVNNLVVDIDKKNFVVGLQIFGASKFLRIPKKYLMKCPNWRFEANLENNKMEVRLEYAVVIRNKVQKIQPIIVEQLKGKYADSTVVASPIAC